MARLEARRKLLEDEAKEVSVKKQIELHTAKRRKLSASSQDVVEKALKQMNSQGATQAQKELFEKQVR